MNPYRDAFGRFASKQNRTEFIAGVKESITKPRTNLSKKGSRARRAGRTAAKVGGLLVGASIGAVIGTRVARKRMINDAIKQATAISRKKRTTYLEKGFWSLDAI